MTHDIHAIQTAAIAALFLLALAACAGERPKGESVWRDTSGQARSDEALAADIKSCNLANRSSYSPTYAGDGMTNPYLGASNIPSTGEPYPEFKACMDGRGWRFIETR